MNEQQAHPWREDLGAYLVGALDREESERMRLHLEQCPSCRAEYEQLAPVVGLLATIPAEALTADAAAEAAGAGTAPAGAAAGDPAGWERLRARAGLAGAPAPSAAPEGRPASRPVRPARGRIKRHPLRPTAAAALSGALVAAVAFGIYAGVQGGGNSGATAGTDTVSAANAATGVSGTVQYRPTGWGSWVQITLKGVKPGDKCVLVAMDGAGDKAVASTWWAPYPQGQSATIPGGVSMRASDIQTFQVTTTVGRVLLTIPAS